MFDYSADELVKLRDLVQRNLPPVTQDSFPHLTITESAFPPSAEHALMDYTRWFEQLDIAPRTKILCRAILMSILEEISYTRKDGQYLRWDTRAAKIMRRNEIRIAQGKKPVQGIDKGDLPSVRQVLISRFNQIMRDIIDLQQQPPLACQQELLAGNVLFTLPRMAADRFHGVITSPPYANRYDYTRTYALELAYLNVGDDIFRLRQDLLSCTVENRPKIEELGEFYRSINRYTDYREIIGIIEHNAALQEIHMALKTRNERGDINNSGVLSMIDQYFSELTFVFAELFRTCRNGAHVIFVNDNVRYAGEVIPVDLLSTNLAEQIGFMPEKVYVLPQRKGNSSQQMGKFGRRALRKSVTVWRKP